MDARVAVAMALYVSTFRSLTLASIWLGVVVEGLPITTVIMEATSYLLLRFLNYSCVEDCGFLKLVIRYKD